MRSTGKLWITAAIGSCKFTELGEHERETEIGNALRGDHVFDGFILSREGGPAKQVVARLLERMNNGALVDPSDIERELNPLSGYLNRSS